MYDDLSPLTFDTIDLVEVPVEIAGQRYVLREPNAKAAAEYRTKAARCFRMRDNEMSGIDGIGEVEPFLVSLCLFSVNEEGFRTSVPIDTVKCWPAKIIKALFDRAKRIGDLDESETAEQLEKTIKRAQDRLAKIKVDPSGEVESKN